jgi:arylsulfatase A-like enzyme
VIEQIFQLLGEKGYLQNAIAVITADHGEALGEHGQWGHGMGLHEEQLRVPLLFYDPAGTADYRNTEFATQVDIGPTLLARLSLPVPETWQGHSLLEPLERRYTYHQTPLEPYGFAVIRAEHGQIYKLQMAPGDPDRPSEQLFDLLRDPGEKVDLLRSADPDLLQDLRAHLDDYRAVARMR